MVSTKPILNKKPKTDKNVAKVGKMKKDHVKTTKAPTEIKIQNKKPKVEKTTKPPAPDAQIKKKSKFVMPSKSVTEGLVTSCLKALQQLSVQQKKKNAIFEDETPIFAEITCMKIQNSRGNSRFLFPHSTAASTGEICLVTPDLKKGKKVDHEKTVDYWEETLRKAGVTKVKTVLPMRQLRVEYDQYELKRRLMTQHDFIMVDTRVLNHVSHILGKMFFKKHNMLIPVRLDEKSPNLKKDIETGLKTGMLRLSQGPTSTITVGHTAMSQKELKDNVLSLVNQLNAKYPGGEANIRSISLKLPLSLSLPLYITLRPNSFVNIPKIRNTKPKHNVVLEDELSTIPGSKVKVAPDGTVHLKKSNINESDEEDLQAVEEGSEVEQEEENSD